MNRIPIYSVLAASLLLCNVDHAWGWGRGGGGGYHASGYSAGGYRAGGYSAGGYRGGEVGGYRGAETGGARGVEVGGVKAGAVGGARGVEVGGVKAGAVGGVKAGEVGGARGVEAGGVKAGEVGGVRAGGADYRAGSVGVKSGHTAMATDFGFSHVAGAAGASGYMSAGHYTPAYTNSTLTARGTAVRGDFYHYSAYNANWWSGHPGAWRPYGWTAATAWGWATWPTLTTWFGWTAPPIDYDYGNTIVYTGNQVVVNGQPGPTAAEYYQQAATLADSAPAVPAPAKKTADEWKPLGVFALVQGDQSDPSAVFQLAVNKAGILGGNYYNILTDTTLPVRGAVDPKSQRASWMVGDQKSTVYDTGVYNLTKDQSPVLIHFGKDRTQEWLLVRVKEKDAQTPPAGQDASLPPPAAGDGVARVTVVVPADAQVYFDGVLTSVPGTGRVYKTPALEKGGDYYYSIRACWTENGQPVEQTRKVAVKAGGQVQVDFTSPLP